MYSSMFLNICTHMFANMYSNMFVSISIVYHVCRLQHVYKYGHIDLFECIANE